MLAKRLPRCIPEKFSGKNLCNPWVSVRIAWDATWGSRPGVSMIVHGKRSITADTALRLSRYFGTSAEFWLDLQTDYDLDLARDELEEKIAREVKHFSPAPGELIS
jgi:addiction module HigA family antidote